MKKIADSPQIDELILKIKQIQENADPKFWPKGLFPSFRYNRYWFYDRKDNSIFFSLLIQSILQEIKPFLTEKNQTLIKGITQNIALNYPHFENTKEGKTYNFYPTKPSQHFGNGLFFKYLKHFQLPDDADDTALVYKIGHIDIEQVFWLQNKLKLHANQALKTRVGLAKKYPNLPVYSTWFGKKMGIEFDMVVHANILNLFLNSHIPLDETALASWQFISENVLNYKFIKSPFEVSPNYANSIVIAYYLAPILSAEQLPNSAIIKEILKKFLIEKLESTQLELAEMAMVVTALVKLDIQIQEIDFQRITTKDTNNFSLFLAGMLSAYSNIWLEKLAQYPFFHIRWKCPAHNLALELEARVHLMMVAKN